MHGAGSSTGGGRAAASGTVTATGTGERAVHPKNRHDNASIVSAYDAARHAAIGGALKDAHTNALAYAKGVGLTLGSVVSVSDAENSAFYGPGEFVGPFGPNQFCGTLRRAILKKEKNGRRKVVGYQEGPPLHRPQLRLRLPHRDLLGYVGSR